MPILNKDELVEVAPVLKPDLVDQVASGIVGLTATDIASVAPFLSQEFMDDFARNSFSKEKNVDQVIPIAPFLSESILNQLAVETLEKCGLSALSPIIPFIDAKIVEDYIRNHLLSGL